MKPLQGVLKTLNCSHGEQMSTWQGLGMVLVVTTKGEHEGVLGAMEMFYILTVVVVTWIYELKFINCTPKGDQFCYMLNKKQRKSKNKTINKKANQQTSNRCLMNVGFWVQKDVTGNKHIFNAGYFVGGGSKDDHLFSVYIFLCCFTYLSTW